jgi:hypothetical protein
MLGREVSTTLTLVQEVTMALPLHVTPTRSLGP